MCPPASCRITEPAQTSQQQIPLPSKYLHKDNMRREEKNKRGRRNFLTYQVFHMQYCTNQVLQICADGRTQSKRRKIFTEFSFFTHLREPLAHYWPKTTYIQNQFKVYSLLLFFFLLFLLFSSSLPFCFCFSFSFSFFFSFSFAFLLLLLLFSPLRLLHVLYSCYILPNWGWRGCRKYARDTLAVRQLATPFRASGSRSPWSADYSQTRPIQKRRRRYFQHTIWMNRFLIYLSLYGSEELVLHWCENNSENGLLLYCQTNTNWDIRETMKAKRKAVVSE